jgi:hypothetical protein
MVVLLFGSLKLGCGLSTTPLYLLKNLNAKGDKLESKSIIGIAWFDENDWELWKKISEDELEDKYEDWVIEASLTKSKLEDQGFTVKQVNITPNNFKNWCKKNFKKLDSSSRSQYVSELLQKAHS